MPFSMLQLALGASFFLMWLFIGGSMLGARMAEVRRERLLSDAGEASHRLQGAHTRRSRRRSSRKRVAVRS